jgi:hypothetical protein
VNEALCGGEQHGETSEHRRCAAVRFRHGQISLDRLWAYYYGIGGDEDELALDAYLHELGDLSPLQVRLVFLAMAEMAVEDNREGSLGP